jgi:hypothetical protein
MRRISPLLIAALFASILAGCGTNSPENGTNGSPLNSPAGSPPSWIEPSASTSNDITPSPSAEPSQINQTSESTPDLNDHQAELEEIGQEVVEILRERDLRSLTNWIDPVHGIRFSPYSYMNKETDLVFTPDTLPTFQDKSKLTWGTSDGSGEPIELTFRDYFERFVYNKDFADAPNISVNKIMGIGNVEFNGAALYPGASYVEFHFPGFDKQFEGMDWQSLVLVFVPQEDDRWKLAAIVHGQWTI